MVHQPVLPSDQRRLSSRLGHMEPLSPGGVNFCGYLRTESGVGGMARRYIRALKATGLPLALLDISDLQTNRSKDDEISQFQQESPFDVNLICADVDLHYSILSHFGDDFFKDRYNIGLWAWELPQFPRKWFDRFAYYDEIWVASAFIAEALSAVSPIPVVRMPPALTLPASGSRDRGRHRLGLRDDEFTFLFAFDVHSHIERKNPASVIEAFRQAFSADDSVRLILKCVNGDSNREGFERLQQLACDPRIEIHDGYWTAEQIRDLMAACDAYVSLHRSEGLGLTITDAMALGKPVIATGWSGNTDFMNVANSYPVRYELTQIQKSVGPYQAGETWADPSVEHAAQCMRAVLEDRASAANRGRAAQHDIETLYSDGAVGQRIAQRLETIRTRRRWPEFRREVHERFCEYQQLPENIRQTVRESLPGGARVLVVSKGDSRLTDLGECQGWHFPQNEDGEYSGYYPADSQQAIDHVENLRAKGAEFLLFPYTAFWWLSKYDLFARHLDSHFQKVADNKHCVVYELVAGRASLAALERQLRWLTDCEQRIRRLASQPTRVGSLHALNGANSALAVADAKNDAYQQLITHVREIVHSIIPKGAQILVVSKGDSELLKLKDRVASHFPQAKNGGYSGHHPADSAAAIAQLESLRHNEDCYLLIPATAYWWLGHYVEFRRHLENCYQRFWNDDRCTIYDLSAQAELPDAAENRHVPGNRSLRAKRRRRQPPGAAATNGRRPS
jgi:glycosyltransferase involved in cell wall biosynthesis